MIYMYMNTSKCLETEICLAHLAKGHLCFYPILASAVVHRKLSHLNLLWNHWTNLSQTWQWWSLGGFLSKLCSTALPYIQDDFVLLKIYISSIDHFCFIINQNELKFYTDISCLGGVFAKNTSRKTENFPIRKYPSQTWYICLITCTPNII